MSGSGIGPCLAAVHPEDTRVTRVSRRLC
ncbi:hypothetical protein [Uliginosibacterium flavum]|uniref:GHMP kinase C-terminal domain-containing protein n=1 Tax=Uliginosibacterium flavum TaxID=1396831 RepID=A0ABV2TL89_9RHOO